MDKPVEFGAKLSVSLNSHGFPLRRNLVRAGNATGRVISIQGERILFCLDQQCLPGVESTGPVEVLFVLRNV